MPSFSSMGDRSRTPKNDNDLEQLEAGAERPRSSGSDASNPVPEGSPPDSAPESPSPAQPEPQQERTAEPQDQFWRSGVPYRDLIEQVRDYAIFCTDAAGRAMTWNKGVGRVLGYGEEDFLGVDVTRIFTPEDVADGVPEWEMREAAQQGSANDNRWMQRRDGTRFYCVGMTTALRDEEGALIGFAKVMQDRTLQHEQGRELQEKTAHLARANSEKERFLAVLSHELRNPLASIRSAVDVLRIGAARPGGASRAIEVIDRQCRQLTYLVDDLLDLSRVSRGRMTISIEPIRLGEVAEEVGEDQRPAFERAGIELQLRIEGAPIVAADRVRIRQVIANLLDNALKFTPRGTVVLAVRPSGRHALIEVSDTGIGVEPEALGNIFELFAQVDRVPASQTVGTGLGLGLALVKGLVDLHGGEIEAHSEGPNRGTIVRVRLPLGDASLAPRTKHSAANEHVMRKVLIIDDDADAADTLSAALLTRGHEVVTAHTGTEGVDRAMAVRPDILFCDIGLPDIDGYEVARRIKAQLGPDAPRMIALSGYAEAVDVDEARAAGYDRRVAKPPDLAALDRLISSLHLSPGDGSLA